MLTDEQSNTVMISQHLFWGLNSPPLLIEKVSHMRLQWLDMSRRDFSCLYKMAKIFILKILNSILTIMSEILLIALID